MNVGERHPRIGSALTSAQTPGRALRCCNISQQKSTAITRAAPRSAHQAAQYPVPAAASITIRPRSSGSNYANVRLSNASTGFAASS